MKNSFYLVASQERNTRILPVFPYHFTIETPVPLSRAFANVPPMLSMKRICTDFK
jgi:hypothetical protein